ncbi:hypothetical protein A2U01_0012378 [Trifolium medium]|uniref:Uncharacterized protein n=1 Tax=Trifolium medium TaxID=97028 RepID=A0A392MVD8_9FABA|nr:hypothetical protein [Trifolium medium]
MEKYLRFLFAVTGGVVVYTAVDDTTAGDVAVVNNFESHDTTNMDGSYSRKSKGDQQMKRYDSLLVKKEQRRSTDEEIWQFIVEEGEERKVSHPFE